MTKPLFNSDVIDFFTERYPPDSFVGYLGARLISTDGEVLIGELKVTKAILNSQGFLHGGVSLAVGETFGSFASLYLARETKKYVAGLAADGDHFTIAYDGEQLTIETRALVIEERAHLWYTMIKNQKGATVSTTKLRCLVFEKAKPGLPSLQA